MRRLQNGVIIPHVQHPLIRLLEEDRLCEARTTKEKRRGKETPERTKALAGGFNGR